MSEPEKGADGVEGDGVCGAVCCCCGDADCVPCCAGALAEGAGVNVWLADVPGCCARSGEHKNASTRATDRR
jgi:hypothetical protein